MCIRDRDILIHNTESLLSVFLGVTFTTRFTVRGMIEMAESEKSEGIVESPLSQNFYLFVWALASVASFAIFIVFPV